MRVSLSVLFGLLVALGVFLVVQGFVAQSQFRRTTNEQLQGGDLVNYDSVSSDIQTQNSGKPRKLTAFSEPSLPPVVSLAAVKPPTITAPEMAIPQLGLPFGVSAGGAPVSSEETASAEQAGSTSAPAKPAQQPVLRAGNLVLAHRVAPKYPRRAYQQHLEGTVTVSFTVQPDGSVSDPVVTGASPRRGIFDEAALRAVGQWKFKPIPAATQTSVTLVFNPSQGH